MQTHVTNIIYIYVPNKTVCLYSRYGPNLTKLGLDRTNLESWKISSYSSKKPQDSKLSISAAQQVKK